MFDISKRLLYYKKKEVQKLIVDSSIDKEVGIRYGNRGYGKRPDIFVYPNDVMETVKKGATSFHVSEERWINPLDISTNMSRKELDELRSGWDLVLDIDCPYWFLSKLTTHMFILALKEHKIKSISCKFSGNKGFHIGVPYEAFPTEVNSIPVKNWFPDGPKKIALYLLNYITTNFIKVKKDEIIFVDKYRTNIQQISKITGKGIDELSKNQCTKCKKELKNIEEKNKIEYLCSKCGNRMFMNEHKIMVCQKCSSLMKKIEHESSLCDCGSNDYETIFNPLSIVEVDTILISSRHMYRAPYGMHEKSGLISLPIKPDEVMKFEKEIASPDNFDNVEKLIFLDSRNAQNNEATQLMINSFDIGKEHFVYKKTQDIFSNENKKEKTKVPHFRRSLRFPFSIVRNWIGIYGEQPGLYANKF